MSRRAVLVLLLLGPVAATAHPRFEVHVHGLAEVGGRHLDGRAYLVAAPGVLVESERMRLSWQPFLNVRLDPPGLRTEDWDELTDFGRLLPRLEIGAAHERWSVRVGPLAHERLGHGTVVADLVGGLDPDHLHTGAAVHAGGARWRAEVLASELLAAQVVAARVAASPVDRRWTLGGTAAADLTAPTWLDGTLDSARRPQGDHRAVTVVALDTDVLLVDERRLALAPYVDAALAATGPRAGRGAVHLGVLADAALGQHAELGLKLEARRLGTGYQPEYFDTLYSLERWRFPLGGTQPKAAAETPATWGGRVELAVSWQESALMRFAADGRGTGPANLSLGVDVFDLAGFDVAAHVAHRGFGGWRELFVDRGWLADTEVRWSREWLSLILRVGRLWRVDEESTRHRPLWDASLSVGASF